MRLIEGISLAVKNLRFFTIIANKRIGIGITNKKKNLLVSLSKLVILISMILISSNFGNTYN